MRLLGALGAKETPPPLQVFLTTHSQVAVVELSADQLHVVRRRDDTHEVLLASSAGDVQGTIRAEPQAMLAGTILVCEGATEVGLIRGIDQFYDGNIPIAAHGAALVDGKGTNTFTQALALQALGYRTAVLRDSDVDPPAGLKRHSRNAVEPCSHGQQAARWKMNCSLACLRSPHFR
ncbi:MULTISPECIES: TOPRIM nucleotidyl transferase/hydrolase domain-containing protein [unclassified Mesorhizobium]|uniref:TOPRIM nucleotidyl transferase/hydrolase domain-containing protein n=2 Tax=Mesorhizobium TaxID=68287 RepID=UPI0033373208